MTEDPRPEEPDFDDLIAQGVDDAAADLGQERPFEHATAESVSSAAPVAADADAGADAVEAEIVDESDEHDVDIHAFFGVDDVDDAEGEHADVVEAVPVDDEPVRAHPWAHLSDAQETPDAQEAPAAQEAPDAQEAPAPRADPAPFWMQAPPAADDALHEPAEAAGAAPSAPAAPVGWMLSEEIDLTRDQLPPESPALPDPLPDPQPEAEPGAARLAASGPLDQPGWDAIARTEVVPPYEAEAALAAELAAPAGDPSVAAKAPTAEQQPPTAEQQPAAQPGPGLLPTPAQPGADAAPPVDPSRGPAERDARVDDTEQHPDDRDEVLDAASLEALAAVAGTAAATAGAAAVPPTSEIAVIGSEQLTAPKQRRRRKPAAPAAPVVPNPVAIARAEARSAILEPAERDTDDDLAQAAIDRVRRWIATEPARPAKRDRTAERLAGLLADPAGLDFAIGFVDRVIRPEDPAVSAKAFEALSRDIPSFLDWYLKFGVTMGGGFGILAPSAIIPMAKRAMRQLVSHLVIDATPERLGKSLANLRADGSRLNVNLLGEAVLGEQEAERRLAGTMALLERDDVDYVSIKVSSMAPNLVMWSFDETVERVVERLLPLYRAAASSREPKFINLDMEEFRDLDLTIAVFTALLDRPEFHHLEAGIVLQAYLPDALGALEGLTAWARRRIEHGRAPIKVRVVKGANLVMERVDAAIHGWPLATWSSKADTDANYKRVLHFALQPGNAAAVRIGVAGHNLFDLAYAIELAGRLGTTDAIDVEMLLGMADEHIAAVRADLPRVLLYTPVVAPAEFDAAVAYLVRRLEENGSGENFMSGMFTLASDPAVWHRERQRFLESVELLHEQGPAAPASNRTQDRAGDLSVSITDPESHDGFWNEPDTDSALASNRAWGTSVLERAAETDAGLRTLELNRIEDVPTLDRRIERATAASTEWAARGAAERARILQDAALSLGAYRGRLLAIMAAETGKTLAEGDPEVSEAIDFCRYYADQATLLEQTEHAEFQPVALTVVTPPWNFPVAIPAGGVAAALATGSAVIIKPAPQARRSAAVLLEAMWAAGVPRDVLVLCDMEEGEVSKRLVTHPGVGRLILTGSSETAAMFTSWRPDLPLLAETSGKNAMIITPSADLDLAVADLVKSAFGHAGQKCSAASIAILVGSVGRSERFERQLVDAVRTLRVGWPTDPTVHVGPVIQPASGNLLQALTRLEEGESWLVEPRQLDAEGRLWSPAVRQGVRPGSFTHVTELFGPHLSIIRVDTLDEAIAVQNGTPFGLTAGIHSLDVDEVSTWLASVEAGNLYVNRGTTGAIVRRQPFGGWKASQVGPGAKAGGPNYLATLGDWKPLFDQPKRNVMLVGLHARVSSIIESATPQLDFLEFDRIRAGANSDQQAWDAEFGTSHDVSALGVERNVLRYRPAEVLVRLAEDGTMGQLVRILAAATRARATVRISAARPLPPAMQRLIVGDRPALRVEEVVLESDAAFHERLASGAARAPVPAVDGGDGFVRSGQPTRRIRLAGHDPRLREVLAGDVSIAVYDADITVEGSLELLPFLREQAISITAHRFGNPDSAFVDLAV